MGISTLHPILDVQWYDYSSVWLCIVTLLKQTPTIDH